MHKFVTLFLFGLLFGVVATAIAADSSQDAKSGTFSFVLRSRVPSGNDDGLFPLVYAPETWDAAKSAVIVCDMWDTHHSENAANRTAELATRMNNVILEARRRGATIIHAPSNCMATYTNHPARKHVADVPRSKNLPKEIAQWCYQIPEEENGKYPLDQSDADDDNRERLKVFHQELAAGRDPKHPWVSQIATLTIQNEDYITDNGEEVWSILEHRGINNVILMGVHTNMCVLGRPFGLRQMAKNGKHVVLMRDMTDTMYNPEKSPFVSHFTGTDLILEHIEKFVCPTVTSNQILGGKAYRFKGDKRKRLVMIISEPEYRTHETLPEFALKNLGHEFSVDYVFADPNDENALAGLELLETADAILISVRRRALPAEQLAAIRQFVEGGKPVIGIRTASHAFALRNAKAPEGRALWQEFDNAILGGNYSNHHGNGPKTQIEVAQGAADHPILKGLNTEKLMGMGSLYVVSPIAKTATPLIVGTIPGKDSEPVAWTNLPATGNRVFYTSLGHIDDFKNPEFQNLLKNAIVWATAEERASKE